MTQLLVTVPAILEFMGLNSRRFICFCFLFAWDDAVLGNLFVSLQASSFKPQASAFVTARAAGRARAGVKGFGCQIGMTAVFGHHELCKYVSNAMLSPQAYD